VLQAAAIRNTDEAMGAFYHKGVVGRGERNNNDVNDKVKRDTKEYGGNKDDNKKHNISFSIQDC
jgi:hypothetical protein